MKRILRSVFKAERGRTMEKKKYFTVYRMAVVGLMSALVFACTFIHIDVPVPMSNKVMIHFGNIMSLLAALLFGPVTGGLSAGLGSAIYDLTDPVYAPEAWITFLMKFAMAWTAGMIAHSGKAHGERKGKNILAAVCGAGTYVFLYGCKTVVMQRFVMGAVWQAVWPVVISKCSVSLFNAVLASVCSVALVELLRRPLTRAGVFDRLNGR